MNVGYRTLTPSEVLPHLPKVANRASTSDYNATTGTVEFAMGVRQMTFTVSIVDDLDPEEDETVFVVLTEVYLIIETSRGKDVQQRTMPISSINTFSRQSSIEKSLRQ